MKRYNIVNLYIQGSSVSPQVSHGLNNLWKARHSGGMTLKAQALFDDWAHNSEVEINLQGGYHDHLEELYENLKALDDVPSSKFNESQEALAGACTVVTFVANERIVALNNYIRFQRVPERKFSELKNLSFSDLRLDSDDPLANAHVTDAEIFVASYISRLRTIG